MQQLLYPYHLCPTNYRTIKLMGKMTSKENTHPIVKNNKLVTKYEGDVIGDKSEPRDLKWYHRYNLNKSIEFTYS